MAGSVNSNYFSQVNSRFQTEVTRGDGASTQNLKNQSGVTHTAKKSTVKKGGNIAEEGSNLSEAAQKQLKNEATQHAEHAAEHGHEMAHDAGVDIAGNDSPEQNELRSKRGYEREQEALADGPTPDGKVKLTSPEGKTQILTVEDHDHLTAMDDPDITDKHVLDDIPDVNLNAANATLDTQMAQGVSKVAILKTDPKIDAVAESMEVAPAPHLAEPMDIVGPGNDKLSTPMPMEFPPEMERVAAEKAALELASGESHQEAILAGPGLAQATPKAAPAPAENPYSNLSNIDLHGSYKDQIDKMQGHVNNIPQDQLEPLGDAAQARFLKADPPISTACAWAGEVEQLANQRIQSGEGDPAHWQGVKKDAAAFQQMEAEVGHRLQLGGTDLKQLASEKQNFKTTFQAAMVSQPGSNQINQAPQANPAQPTKPAAQAEPAVPTTQLPPQATIEQLDQFSKPLAQTQLTAARSQLNPNQKKDLEQLETDVVRIRGLYKEMGARPQDQQFAAKAQQEIQQTQTRIGEVAGRNHAKNSNFQVIIDPTNGEVFTNLSWTSDKVSPEMQAQGHAGVAYSLQTSPGRTDSELTAWPLAKDGSVGGTYMKYRVASDNPKGWQGVAAVVGDVNGENGYHASAITPGSNALTTHLNSDQQKMTPAQQALANQAMGDAGLTWPGGATPPTPPEQQAYRNQPGQIQQPVQQGFIDRMRYAFTGNQNYAPNYTSAPPPYWQAPQPNYNYMGSYPQYQYPPVNYGGYGGYAGSWGGGYGGGYVGGYGGGGMDTMMKLMMASTMISSIAMPMMFFANSMMW